MINSGFTELDSTIHRDFKHEMRLMSILVAIDVTTGFVSPAIFILTEPSSIIYKTTRLATIPELFGILFLVAGVLALPFILMQMFSPKIKCRRHIMRLTTFAMCAGGVVWFYLAYLSKNLDFTGATAVYLMNGAVAVSLGGILSITLNNKLKRDFGIRGTK